MFTVDGYNQTIDITVVELDKSLIDSGLAVKRNRYVILVDGEMTLRDKNWCQYSKDNNEGDYIRIGFTFGEAKERAMDIVSMVERHDKLRQKEDKSLEKGNNMWINARKERKEIEANFKKNYQLNL